MKKLVYVFIAALLLIPMNIVSLPTYADDTNLIANPSVESNSNGQPVDYTTNSWGSNTASFSYSSTAHTGSHSLRVDVSDYSDGDAKWMATPVAVTAGQTYVYSDFSQSNAVTDLDAAYADAYGNQTFVYLTSIAASSSWQQATATFTVPTGITTVSIYHILPADGWLLTDDFSLTAQTETSPADPTATNLLDNPSFETSDGTDPASWNRGGWGSNTSSLTYLSGVAHTGTHSIQASISSYTDGDVKWYATPVSVVAGEQYTYSDYYTSDVTTRVTLALTDANGVDSYIELESAPAASTWTQYTDTFTVPAGIQKVTIYHLMDKVGILTIDDTELVSGATATAPTNYIPNASLETANGGLPTNWEQDKWGTNTANFTYVTNDGHTGTSSAKVTISNYVDGDAKWDFTPLTTLTPGGHYEFSAWYKTNTQPHVVAAYTDTSGTDGYITLANPLPDTSAATAWQQYETTLDVPSNAVTVTLYFLISSNGWLQVDDYSLTDQIVAGFDDPIISLAFDDGWSSIYTNGLPILEQYGMVSTQYLISGKLNTTNYMTTAQAQAFLDAGSEIGSHTVTHPDLTTLTNGQLVAELSNSQATLRQLFGSTVATDFASPYGTYNATTLAAIQQYYQSHRSTDVGYNTRTNFNPYNIVVQNVDTDTTPAEVAAWVTEAQAEKAWLVLVYHQVINSSSLDDYAVSPQDLSTELQNIQNSGISVMTISQALATIEAQL